MAKTLGLKALVLNVLRELGIVERRIKDVDTWDGVASRWPDTDAYCEACLIDVNAAAGREEKAQTHCKLPVREPGDSADTYVRQAVYAAAGGRGIGRLEKPEDVPQEAWDSAVRAAANEIISAYEEMDEVAPASVWEAAGKEPPEEAERALPVEMVYGEADNMVWDEYAWMVDMFIDTTGQYAVAAKEGMLYKIPVTIEDGYKVSLGEWQPVITEHAPVVGVMEAEEEMPEERSLTICRQADGSYRWVSIACTAILNRVGEIDSRALFDSFLAEIERSGVYPELDLYHLPGSDVGKADYVARDGYTLIASGTFNDDEIGQAVARGLANSEGVWGTSIQYKPLDQASVVSIADVHIPVFEQGILRKVSIVKETQAASLFTNIIRRSGAMDEKVKADLLELLDDEELVEQMQTRVDGVNRAAEGLIARSKKEGGELPTFAEVEGVATPDEALTDEANKLRDHITGLTDTVNKLSEAIETMSKNLVDFSEVTDKRIAALERADKERKAAWLHDLPAVRGLDVATYRPRQEPDSTETPKPSEQVGALLESKGLI